MNKIQKNAFTSWIILSIVLSFVLFIGALNGGAYLSRSESESSFLLYLNHGLIPSIIISTIIIFIGFGLYALLKKK